MVEKPYSWTTGATLEEHSKRKHKVIREYWRYDVSFPNKLVFGLQSLMDLPEADDIAAALLAHLSFSLRCCVKQRRPSTFIAKLRACHR